MAEQKIFSLSERNETTEIRDIKDIIIKDFEIIDARHKSKSEFTGIPSGGL